MPQGVLNSTAPELRVETWIDGAGQPRAQPLRLADLGDGFKVIFAFQHACPGCHTHGFPTLKLLHDALSNKGFGFAVLQTAFEDFTENTADKLRLNQERHALPIPFGHDSNGQGLSSFMQDYQTGGTPWFTMIDPEGKVVYSEFQLDARQLLRAFGVEHVTADP